MSTELETKGADLPVILNNEELESVAKNSGIELTKAQQHAAAFGPSLQEVARLSQALLTINKENPTPEDSKLARRHRLDLVKVRSSAKALEEQRKEGLNAERNLLIGLGKVVSGAAQLAEQEYEEIEKHAEKKEQERIENLKTKRITLLDPFKDHVNLTYIPIGEISEEDFQKLLADSKLLHETKVEAARKLEYERIAREKEEARMKEEKRLENERIKSEKAAEEKARQEREKIQQERLNKLLPYSAFVTDTDMSSLSILTPAEFNSTLQSSKAKFEKAEEERKTAELEEAKQKAEMQRQRQELAKKEADLKAEQEKQTKLLADQKKQKEEEEAKQKEFARQASLAPDREKLLSVIIQLDAIKYPEVTAPKSKIAINDTIAMVEKLKAFIIKRSEEL